jgi:glycosyltransferase involved in cell wall biosynthesis
MHILYVSQYFPPEPGAPAARVSELARAWVEAGHQVTVLTGMPHHPTGIVPPEYRQRVLVGEDFHGVRVVRTWIYAAANRGRLRRSVAYASFAASAALWGQFHVDRPDVLVATSPQFLCAVAGHAIARMRSLPFVFEVRDLWPESIVAVGALPAGHPIVRGLTLIEEHLYRRADRIVVVTDSFAARLRQRGVAADKIEVVKNGVDLDRFVPASHDTQLRQRLGYAGKFVVGYVGTHGMAHGLDSVLDVAAALRSQDQIRFLFVGEGAERQRLQARAKSELLDNVLFLGALPRDAMTEVYATSDLCLVPLRKSELFQTVLPSKIFEILGMARPVLLSVDGEARALVEASGGGVFVPPEDAPAMAEAILRLAQDPAACRDMGERGRAYVKEHFDRKQLAASYLGILEGVAGKGRA